jgi:DNA-binding NarL/FixJ family response regulator
MIDVESTSRFLPHSDGAEVIRIAVVEDHDDTRENLQRLFNQEPGLQLLCACASAHEAMERIPPCQPDVVLMDIHLPEISGIECVARLKQRLPALHVLMWTVYEDDELILSALKAGASGYLLKRTPPARLVEAVAEVRNGGAPMSGEIARKVVASFHASPPSTAAEALTQREEEVLRLLARGFVAKEVAAQLGISYDTVRTHLKHIYEKLHVRSRTEAVLKFLGE